jgi:uncharacterized membrane protein YiaA
MSRFIITFLVCCFLGAIIFLILLLTVSFKVYLITVLVFGLFGIIIDWAKHPEEYEKRRN